MERSDLYVATTAADAAELAREYDLGLELDEFTYSPFMYGREYTRNLRLMRERMASSRRFVLHAPFAELCPAAIDCLVLEATRFRLKRAWEIAASQGLRRLVVHSGYVPGVYYPEWYVEKAAEFWREFLADKPADTQILVENVMDDDPALLAESLRLTDDPRCRACLDIGHAAVHGRAPVTDFVAAYGPYLAHVHLHDNDGVFDQHWPLGAGSLPLAEILHAIADVASPTYTLENQQARPAVDWLLDNDFLR